VPWLIRGAEVLASLDVAETRSQKRKGLLGKSDYTGVLMLRTRSIHTIGMRFPIDVAVCDSQGVVLSLKTIPPGRVVAPRFRETVMFEAQAGTLRDLNVKPGDHLEMRP